MDAAQQLERDAGVTEMARIEDSAIGLADRLRGGEDAPLTLLLKGNLQLSGTLACTGHGWLLMSDGNRSVLVPLHAVIRISGLPGTAVKPVGTVRHSLASVLRTLARDRAAVHLYLEDSEHAGPLAGVFDRVGFDYVELAVTADGEPRRQRNVLTSYAIPFAALVAVSSRNNGRP
ncbi:hypothetical protein [Paenarthrobacter sp. PH39-S1]|uniref:hypothetical protein n=1 Tax=Paenarthrobacter sp. PH39-S1 TaxID=3046204 RepID=UPI0024B995D1|nr:hypothetical protein [Paenarthrobacter sp. PH39-S1]MDJ0356443.1 hypothetical protein [Paenarthrobacter sp. PH39-S1]